MKKYLLLLSVFTSIYSLNKIDSYRFARNIEDIEARIERRQQIYDRINARLCHTPIKLPSQEILQKRFRERNFPCSETIIANLADKEKSPLEVVRTVDRAFLERFELHKDPTLACAELEKIFSSQHAIIEALLEDHPEILELECVKSHPIPPTILLCRLKENR